MESILILGSMHDFEELTKTCIEKGYYTIVCDQYVNGPAKKIANVSYDIDVFETEEIVKIARKHNVRGVITGFSDVLLEAYVPICKALDLPCYLDESILMIVRNKVLMKEKLSMGLVNTVDHFVLDELSQERKKYKKMVLKPIDGYGSRGIYIINDQQTLDDKYTECLGKSKLNKVLVEEYCEGNEYSCMAWVTEGKGYLLYIGRREKYKFSDIEIPLPFRFIYPADEFDMLKVEVQNVIKRIIESYGIKEGPLAIQFFYHDNKVIVGEATTRLFGDGDHRVVYYARGLKVEELLIDYVMGAPQYRLWPKRLENYQAKFDEKVIQLQLYAREGKIKKIVDENGVLEQSFVYHYEFYFNEGDSIKKRGTSLATVGMVFLKITDGKDVELETKKILEGIRFEDVNGNNLLLTISEKSVI